MPLKFRSAIYSQLTWFMVWVVIKFSLFSDRASEFRLLLKVLCSFHLLSLVIASPRLTPPHPYC